MKEYWRKFFLPLLEEALTMNGQNKIRQSSYQCLMFYPKINNSINLTGSQRANIGGNPDNTGEIEDA
jgi:hypothetical protein